jgi:hypothetical protein
MAVQTSEKPGVSTTPNPSLKKGGEPKALLSKHFIQIEKLILSERG